MANSRLLIIKIIAHLHGSSPEFGDMLLDKSFASEDSHHMSPRFHLAHYGIPFRLSSFSRTPYLLYIQFESLSPVDIAAMRWRHTQHCRP